MPAKVQMNIMGLTTTTKTTTTTSTTSKNLSMSAPVNRRGGNMNLFDISKTKKGCSSCGGG